MDGKQRAAEAAALLVQPGMVVGLGTGSTSAFFVCALGARIRDGLLIAGGIPTSDATAALAQAEGVPLTTLDMHPVIDLAVDGADEVEPTRLDLIKGAGGALLREKIVASASRRFVVVVDEAKLVTRLGERFPVPVELVPFAHGVVPGLLRGLGAGKAAIRLRQDGTPFLTDNGNLIADAGFDPIADPATLETAILALVGVVDCGLFIGRTDLVLVGGADGVRRLTRGQRIGEPVA
jgi:ribose 5-phosphate isomerase A